MGRTISLLVVGLAAWLALPAMAADTPLTDKNTKVTNTIGSQGADTANNGNGNAKFDSATGIWEVNGGGEGLWNDAEGITLVDTDGCDSHVR